MKPLPDMKGYQNVVLCKNGNSYNKIIHRLVAQAFIPNPNNLPEVNHKDGNKANNHVDNLEWITHRENVSHGKLMYNKTSKYSGVCFKNNGWTVSVQYLGKIHTVDGFGSEDLAREYHLNFLKEKGLVNRFA